jgi:feruloyl esterase
VISGLAIVLAAQASVGGLPAATADCASLKSLQLPDVRITNATPVAAGAAAAVRDAHCVVEGTVGREIRFRLLLPSQWNGKFMMGGGGGFVGAIDNQALASVNMGYATVGTDTGHQGPPVIAAWALNDVERQVNYGHAAVHRVSETAKAIIRHHYGAPIARSYFNGCSNGGRQALMEAQRYPDDFDGIIAGAPALDFTAIGAQFIKDIKALYPDPRNISTAPFTAAVLSSVERQIVEKCDAADGVTDGLLEDPRRCSIDVNALAGLTGSQKQVLAAIYAETRNSDGVIYPAQPVGSEGDPDAWQGWIVGPNKLLALMKVPSLRFAFGTEMFKYFIFNDPNWDYSKYDFSTFKQDVALPSTFLNATNPNLDAFKARNGKLIVWHGWSDPALSALGTIKYVDAVRARDASSGDYLRTFLMPGVLHCVGGPGPDRANWIGVLEHWVEKGIAPERVIASKNEGGKVVRTRPLCAYPLRAVYNGTGSIDEEKNFTCSKVP